RQPSTTYTLSLHDALPIYPRHVRAGHAGLRRHAVSGMAGRVPRVRARVARDHVRTAGDGATWTAATVPRHAARHSDGAVACLPAGRVAGGHRAEVQHDAGPGREAVIPAGVPAAARWAAWGAAAAEGAVPRVRRVEAGRSIEQPQAVQGRVRPRVRDGGGMSDTTTQVFEDPDRHKPGFVPSQHLVTSVRVERGR